MNFKKIFLFLEYLGVFVLALVMISNLGLLDNPELRESFTPSLWISMCLMSVAILIAIPISMYRLLKNKGFDKRRLVFGVILMLIGGVVVYLVPSYFEVALGLEIGFWYKVSIFSLPAICIEGAVFTICTELQHTALSLNNREYRFLNWFFVIYIVGAVSTNFLVINRVWEVVDQVHFYRIFVFLSVLTLSVLYLRHRK